MPYTREIDSHITIQYIILFTLAKVDRHVTYKQLTSLILDNLNIEFTNFQLALSNLEAIGHVRSFVHDELTTFYELLPAGKQANGFFEKEIPIYIREQVEEAIEPFFREEAEKNSIRTELMPINPREFCAKCGVYDRNTPLLEMTVYAGSREDANNMMKRFNENAQDIYTKIMDIMHGENTDNE